MLSNVSVISGKSSEELAKKLSKRIKANLVKSMIRVFPDGESKITLSGKISKKTSIVVQSIYPPVDSNLIQALALISKAKDRPDLVKKIFNKARTDGIKTTINAVMARLDNPIPLGYSAAGTVISVGPELEGNFQVGQRVAIAGAGIANHSEINAVPANLAVQIPEGVSDEELLKDIVHEILEIPPKDQQC